MTISEIPQAIWDTMDAGILIEDVNRIVIVVNKAMCQMFRLPYPAEWILGQNHLEYLKRRAEQLPVMQPFQEKVKSLSTAEELVPCADIEQQVGKHVLRYSYTPLFVEGKLSAHIWQFWDITEQVRLREELHSKEEFYRSVLENAPVDVAVFGQDLRFVYINKQGIKSDELRRFAIGKTEGEYSEARGRGREFGDRRTQYMIEAAQQRKILDYLEEINVHGVVRKYLRRIFAYFENSNSAEPQFYVGFGMDVTEVMETRHQLDVLNGVQANTLQSLPIWPYSIEFRDGVTPKLLYARNEMMDFINASHKHSLIKPMRWYRGIHPEDRYIIREVIRLIRTGEKMQGAIEFRWYLAGVGYIWLRNYYKAVPQTDGSLILYGLVNDESRIKAKDRKIAKAENDLRIMMENLDIEICAFNSKLELVAANSNFHQIHQMLYGKPASIGKHLFDTEEPIFADEGWQPRIMQVLEGQPVDREVVRYYGGKRYVFKCELRPIFFEGEVVGATFARYDITEMRNYALELEQLLGKLKTTEVLFRQISSSVSDLICLHELDGIYRYVSPSSAFFVGLPPESLIGTDPYEMIHPEFRDVVADNHRRVLQGKIMGGETDVEYQMIRHDGTYLWVESSVTLVMDAQGNPESILTVTRDITHRKRIEEEMKTALVKERELNEMKSRFVNTISHEFRTPLSTMLTSVDLLELISEYIETPRTKDRVVRHVGIIREEIMRVNQLMNEVLLLGRQQANTIVFRPEQIEVVSFCRDIIASTFRLKKQEVRLDFESPVSELWWRLDRTLMSHVIRNLLSNAVKYSGSSNKNIIFRLEVSPEELVLSITDFGIGIPQDEKERLFEPFFRASNTGSISGTGIGLSLVKQFVEMHCGTVSVESQMNMFTTFTITLPYQAHEQNPVD